MEEIADEKNLRIAFMEVASNKGAPGPDRQSIDEVRERIDSLLPALASALLDGSYRPGTIRRVWIPKAGGGRRDLGIPNVIDRLVQQAVHRVLSPHLEATFHESSHGFRPGRGCHTAIAAAKEHLEAGHQWLVDIDLKSFFDRVHHQRLLARLEQLGVKDPRVLRLIHRMLKAKVVLPNGVLVATKEGTPQGGPLSPLLSNVVLDELDLELERRGLRFVRYADDCNVYVRSERAGLRVMASLTRFIERHLRLEVNHGKSAVARPATRHFVGFCLQRSRDGVGVVRLSARSRNRINRRVVELTRRNWGNSLDAAIERINQYLKGWIGFFHIVSKAEVYNLGVIDAHIRRRLRALVLRQKKRRTHIVRWLHRERRVALKQARIDVYGNHRSLWALSITKSAHKAMSSHWFDRLGLLRLKRLWRQRNADPIAPAQLVLELG
jgi:group II intron reverse transcriptase/maturase